MSTASITRLHDGRTRGTTSITGRAATGNLVGLHGAVYRASVALAHWARRHGAGAPERGELARIRAERVDAEHRREQDWARWAADAGRIF